MNIFKILSELEEMRDRSKDQSDIILDYYKKDPIKAKNLLLELSEIEKELDELEKQFIIIQNEIC
jgi:hypothetical protein